ncbi:MAG TPA: O-antigen ligase family protein [Rhizobiaceae bacterium]|nr:O-antigen ligase family protein [Rhizobiaceae bacterium]
MNVEMKESAIRGRPIRQEEALVSQDTLDYRAGTPERTSGVPTQHMSLARYPFIFPQEGWGSLLARICVVLFVIGMALLGSSKLSGYVYVASLLVGSPVLFLLPWREIHIPPAVRVYTAFYLSFVVLVLAHLVVFSAPISNIDQVSRIGIGLVNGLFFTLVFGFSRERLFNFIILLAAAHMAVACVVALYQGVDFLSLELARGRVHGSTNPLPFSEMLLVSLGLVSLFLAARVDRHRPLPGIALLTLTTVMGLFAIFLTGARGTMICFLLLFPLLWIVLIGKVNPRMTIGFAVAAVLALLIPASLLAERNSDHTWEMLVAFFSGADASAFKEDSIGLRFQLWTYALQWIGDAPLFGYGLNSFPHAFRAAEFGLPADSMLLKFNNVHNQYLDMVLNTGLVGAVLFFGPLVVALVAGLRMARDPVERLKGLAIIWVGCAYGAYGLTQTFYGHSNTSLQYGVYLGMLIWTVPYRRKADQRPDVVS